MPLPHSVNESSARRLLRDEVYATLQDAIVDGTLVPGEILRDDELTSWLGVSRTPVRQALNRLEDIGLVEMPPGRPARVAEFDAALVNQATYTTGILHEYSIRRTIPYLSDEQLAELDAHLAIARRAARASDLTVVGPAIRDFFRVFHLATGNRVLYDTVEQNTPMLLRFLSPRENLMPMDDILAILEDLNSAVRARSVEAASSAIHGLYATTRAQFVEKFRPALAS
ncbi:GntR family transcriptional regulator [Microbacterium sp. NPDC089695]|uniref:GntR family transcriptional regulator n=1 Tax=Microbacterium sp. NPDC089695 TaxID=3364198 RepID=UPI003829D9E4